MTTKESNTISPGQIIRARERLWRVDEVIGNEIIVAPIDGDLESRTRFLTTLETIEPAAFDEINPEILGEYSAQQLLIRAYKLSLLHGSAPFQSLQRSSVVPVNYQLVPLVMAMELPKVRMLIADDVGLGKTIEAGLIASELIARGLVKRILVITPAQLREQWLDAMEYFFHLDFKILSSETRREYEKLLPADANPWQHFKKLIVSFDYAKMPEHKINILEQQWDMVLVDEAHNGAKPHQTGEKQKIEMQRWKLLEDLSTKTEHLIFLTATPHNGYRDSFSSLLKMLNPEFVSGTEVEPVINKEKARKSVVQRTRKDLETWFEAQGQKSPFPKRDAKEVIISPHKDLLQLLSDLDSFSNKIMQAAGSNKKALNLTRWLILHFQKRALSSPYSLNISLKSRIERIKEYLSKDEGVEGSIDILSAMRYVTDENLDGRRTDEDIRKSLDKSLVSRSRESLEDELEALIDLTDNSNSFTKSKDRKLQKLTEEVLPELLYKDPKVIVFTYYKDTLDYLQKNLEKSDLNAQFLVMHGDLSAAARREVFAKFNKSEKAVLIATDVISEGLNLQHICSQVVHYELPWNPNRLEQRNGRVDRFGQPKKTVTVRTLVTDRTLDIVILNVLMRKARNIREDRGYCPPFFGDDANIADLILKRSDELNLHEVTQLDMFKTSKDEVTNLIQKSVGDPYDESVLDRIEEDSFYNETDISLPDIEARLKKTEEMLGSRNDLYKFTKSALNKFSSTIKKNKDDTFKILLPDPRLRVVNNLNKIERATFDPKQGLADPDVVVLDIGHPLIRRLIELVKNEFFRQGATGGRTSAVVKSDVKSVTVVYYLLVRFSVNTDPPRVIEEMIPFGFEPYGDHILSEQEIANIENMESTARQITDTEASDRFKAALKSKLFEESKNIAINSRKMNLINERRELIEKLVHESGAIHDWLKGMDDLTIASMDILTATLYLPV